MLYMLWMMTNKNNTLPQNIRLALEYHEKKYGRVPNVVEYSQKLVIEPLPVPELESVALLPVNIPSNILYVGVRDEN